MAVDVKIRKSIDSSLKDFKSVTPENFRDALGTIIRNIFLLGNTNIASIMHTSAYLSYKISSILMGGNHKDEQYKFGQVVTSVLRDIYDDQSLLDDTFNPIVNHSCFLEIFANIYTFHARLLFYSPNGSDDDALSLLRYIVGSTLGSWMAHISINGNMISDPNIQVIPLNGSENIPTIVIGNLNINTHLRSIKAVTWNMQGSTSCDENKWRNRSKGVLRLARAYNILCLQEAGCYPLSSDPVAEHTIIDQFSVEYIIEEYAWNAGTTSRPERYTIYFFDVKRLRVNLAIVLKPGSTLSVRNFIVISDGLNNKSETQPRPAVGISINSGHSKVEDITFFTFHALSNGGSNSPIILREVSRHIQTPFVILGDFNRDPRLNKDPGHPKRGNWISPPPIGVITEAARDTHGSDTDAAMLDYAVSDNATSKHIRCDSVIPGLLSDHCGATFIFNFS